MDGINIIDKLVAVPSMENMNVLINWAKNEEISDDEIIYLSKTLANSGQILKLPTGSLAADIPSTGGPTSLSTLICPLVLKEVGFTVPKLGVKGRPAGGIDVLAQIPNYKVEFNLEELLLCLKQNGYCHFMTNEMFAPLDAILFSHREANNAKAVVPLVISSILSKKIAVNLNYTGLDVRVAKYCNFGTNWEDAKINSLKFIRISKKLGINAVCFLNDINYIQQPFIGRGESLLALFEIFYDQPNELLKKHLFKCINMGLSLMKSEKTGSSSLVKNLKQHFVDNLRAQGSSEKSFIDKAHEIKNNHRYKIIASKSGFLKINIEMIRDSILWGQSKINNNKFSDSCGLIFKKYSNEFLGKNETILTYRVDNCIILPY